MIEFAGLAYGLLKDIASFLKLDEEDKLVDMPWLEESGFGEVARNSGFELRWVTFNKIESTKLKGYQVLYEIDEVARKKRRIIASNELVLMGKPK